MKPARIIVLAIALIAGGIAAYLASGSDTKAPVQAVVQGPPTVDILVAKNDIALGQTVNDNDMEWQTWTQTTASSSFIRRTEGTDAKKEIVGSIARSPFIAGEPIREQKLVKANGAGFMAAILPSGMRAVSTEISAETGAGGFILPNDRVDVVLSKHDKGSGADPSVVVDVVVSQVVLTNIRVLAIDQAPKEKDGQNAVLGKTATLELTPDQVQTLAKARLSGTLSLALRSIADAAKTNVASGPNKSITVYLGSGVQQVLDCDPMCGR
ncbi:Flp pilus assembly protein CpaB [Bradyrhizobium sp.]|uniref:Flp pilus assembly protein CpaB n=1 Tax=Bradyrhizobium sp. TaxID=376 RepID=UPI003C5273CF